MMGNDDGSFLMSSMKEATGKDVVIGAKDVVVCCAGTVDFQDSTPKLRNVIYLGLTLKSSKSVSLRLVHLPLTGAP